MADVTIGVSGSGVEELLNKVYQELIVKTEELMNQWSSVEPFIKECWIGDDCDRFLDDVKTKIKEAKNNMDDYYTKASNTIRDEETRWREFRASNNV